MSKKPMKFLINLPFRGVKYVGRKIYGLLRKIYQYRDPYNSIQLYKLDLDIQIIEKDYIPNKDFPKYSSLTPVLNEEQNIVKILDAISAQTILPTEVVIVDGGSTDNTIGVIEQYKKNSSLNIIIVKSPVKNLGYQRNLSLKSATNNIILNIDAGTIPDKNYAANMLGPFLEDENIDLVGGIHYIANKYDWARYFSPLSKEDHFKFSSKPHGNSVAYKRDLALKLARYPEYLTYAGEDTLFFYNYQKASKKWVFNKNAFIIWDHPNSLEEAKHKLYNYIRGNFEIGFWPYYYYDYIFFPFLHRANLNLPLFQANYNNFLIKQAEIEIQKRKIKGICCIISKNRIDDKNASKMKDYAFKMIADNYKVFFINCNKKSNTILKKSKSYLDTDITLLELVPYKYFSIENLQKRYGDIMDNAICVLDIDDHRIINQLEEIKNNNLKNIKIMYDIGS